MLIRNIYTLWYGRYLNQVYRQKYTNSVPQKLPEMEEEECFTYSKMEEAEIGMDSPPILPSREPQKPKVDLFLSS